MVVPDSRWSGEQRDPLQVVGENDASGPGLGAGDATSVARGQGLRGKTQDGQAETSSFGLRARWFCLLFRDRGADRGNPGAQLERRRTGGVFFWGIGNPVGPGIAELGRRVACPEVLFSPIKSPPRVVDVHPPAVVRWHGAVTPAGEHLGLPETVLVESGYSKAPRYALVCESHDPLRPRDLGELKFAELRNIVTGNPLGASQVTAVVERLPVCHDGRAYVVALRARLVAPFFVRLVDPVVEPLDALADRPRAA